MILRKWTSIKPIETSPNEIPVWLNFKGVPPTLITPQGLSWLASQVGQSINKFIRDGLDVKVCVLKDISKEVKTSFDVVLAEGEHRSIAIEYPELRSYKRKGNSVWTGTTKAPVSKSYVHVPVVSSSDNVVEPLHGEGEPGNSLSGTTGGEMGNGSKASVQAPLEGQF
ncbi:hypothetical protein LINPERPRIM_LOCUS32893 [Linum perenne]